MMNIKKTALLLCLSLGAYTGYAQTKWNVKAGVAFSNVDAKNKAGDKASTAAVAGLYLGLGPTLQLSEYFSLEPAFIFARPLYRLWIRWEMENLRPCPLR